MPSREQLLQVIIGLVTGMTSPEGVKFPIYDATLSLIRETFGPDTESRFDRMVEVVNPTRVQRPDDFPEGQWNKGTYRISENIDLVVGFFQHLRDAL